MQNILSAVRLCALLLTLLLSAQAQFVAPIQPTDEPASPSEDAPGSVLIYNLYSSFNGDPQSEDTRLTITNTHPASSVWVRFYFINGTTGAKVQRDIQLSPRQTKTLLASEVDPGVRGYVIASAIQASGCPLNFNYLLGSAFIKLATGHGGQLPALGVRARATVACVPRPLTLTNVTLNFNGTVYDKLPDALSLNSFSSYVDGNWTMLIVNGISPNLTQPASAIGGTEGKLFDDATHDFNWSYFVNGPQLAYSLGSDFPFPYDPSLAAIVPSGRTGWMYWRASSRLAVYPRPALTGAVLTLNTNGSATAFSGAHNLQHLTLRTAQLVMPVTSVIP